MENLASKIIKEIDIAFKTFKNLSDFYNKIIDIKEKYEVILNNQQKEKNHE